MKSEGSQSERPKDQATIEHLKQLAQKLCTDDITVARLAAFNLSWLQEDGLAILNATLLGNFSRTAKKAAAYGLRSMRGRMKKLAVEVLEQGLKHRDRTTKAACVKALFLMRGGTPPKGSSQKNRRSGKPRIQEIPKKSAGKPQWNRTPSDKRR